MAAAENLLVTHVRATSLVWLLWLDHHKLTAVLAEAP